MTRDGEKQEMEHYFKQRSNGFQRKQRDNR